MVAKKDASHLMIDPDSLFDALADTDRRRVLAALLDAQTQTVDDLARTLAGIDGQPADRCSAELSTNAIDRHHLRLYHVHLPRLADAGLVSYDSDQNVVALTASQASREAMMTCVDGSEQ